VKTLGNLLLAISLTVGVLAAAPAYLARLDLPDDRLIGQTLGAPAGKITPGAGKPAPIAKTGETLTPELLEKLRAASVTRVRVKDFAFARWETRWFFLLAVVGLGAGATLLRLDTKRRREGGARASIASGATPEQSLTSIIQTIDRIESDLPGIADPRIRLSMIADRVGEAQKKHVDAFLNARDVMIPKLGLSGYAAVMDRFASGERQINRAWSAAVDGVEGESVACLRRGRELINDTLALLRSAR